MPREDHNGPGFRYVVEYRKDEGKQSEKHDHVVDASQSQVSEKPMCAMLFPATVLPKC